MIDNNKLAKDLSVPNSEPSKLVIKIEDYSNLLTMRGFNPNRNINEDRKLGKDFNHKEL